MSRYIAKCQEKKIEDYQSEGTKYWQKFFFHSRRFFDASILMISMFQNRNNLLEIKLFITEYQKRTSE